MDDTILKVYLWGVFVATLFFYAGAVRGKARNGQIWSAIFGLLWFITLPVLIFQVWKSFRNDRKEKR